MRILNRRPTVCSFAVCLVLGASSSANAADEKQFSSRFTRFTQKYCTKCHGGGEPEAGFSLEVFKDLSAVIKDAKAIKTATGYVAENTMPPEKNPKPTKAEIDDFVGYINGELDAYYREKNDPGRVTLRRLNRAEYQNTVRDLFGIDVPVVDNLPQDDTGYGFDTIGDVLTVSPIHLERYLAAAEKVVGIAVVDPKNYRPPVRVIRPESMEGGRMAGTARILATNGEVGARLESLRSGGYSIAVRAFEQSAGTEPAKMAVLVDGKEIARFEVKTGRDLPRDFAVNFENSNSGPRRIAVAFLNDYHDPGNPNPRKRDRNLLVLSIRVEGPLKYDEKTHLKAIGALFLPSRQSQMNTPHVQ